MLAYLPLGVAVIDEETRLLFWNEHAGALFREPPAMAAEMPLLMTILSGVASLSARQRDTINTFATTHMAAGNGTSPDTRLRLSLERDYRIVIQICGIDRAGGCSSSTTADWPPAPGCMRRRRTGVTPGSTP